MSIFWREFLDFLSFVCLFFGRASAAIFIRSKKQQDLLNNTLNWTKYAKTDMN